MNKHYHFIGIGGIGMGALASLLLAKGHKISGSDIRSNELIENLKEAGAIIHIGHNPEHVSGCDYVVYSSAISPENMELNAAAVQEIPILKRAELLAQLMQEHIGITVAGAHGKTTVTSLVSHILVQANFQPTTAVGGMILGSSNNARLGTGKYFVAEVDESDRSFLQFFPKYSIITNIDLEHVDQYGSFNEILDVYGQFILCVAKDGIIFACGEDKNLVNLLKKADRPFKTYGFSDKHDFWAKEIVHYGLSTSFDCFVKGNNLGQVIIELPGRHNVLNALAAVSLALSLGVEFSAVQKALKSFRGVKRRFQIKEETSNILVIDDYAHHPTEIKATLETAQSIKTKRLLAVFQPHRYTRLKALMEDFAKALVNTDYLIITDVYAASEQPIEGANSKALVDLIRKHAAFPVVFLEKEHIVDHIIDMKEAGDLVLMLGAGDITSVADALCESLRLEAFGQSQKEKSGI